MNEGIPRIKQIEWIRRKCRIRVTVNKSNEPGIPTIKHIELIKRNSRMLVSSRKQGVGFMRRSNCSAPIPPEQFRGQRKNVCDKKGRGTRKCCEKGQGTRK